MIMKRERSKFKIFLLFFIFLSVFIFSNLSFAQLSREEEKAKLEKQLQELEKQIAEYEKDIKRTAKEKETLKNKIKEVKAKINQLDAQIKKGNLILQDLNYQIKDTESSIQKTTARIEDTKKKLANVLQIIYEEDQKSLVEIIIANPKLSDFFDNLMGLEAMHQKTQLLLEDIKNLKEDLESQKQKLDEEKEDVGRVIRVQTLQKQESEQIEKTHQQLLKLTESQYQETLKKKEATEKEAAKIRQRLFELAQIPDVEAPSFAQAYEIAKWASQITGVRPALILGLLQVESAIGRNVGQCNCAGRPSCRYPNLTYKDVMRSNQWPFFETIVSELGLPLNSTPVSCAVNGGYVQWGGAMGPAQFMPGTWLNNGYKNRVENILGTRPANPWRVRDAFLAAALYLADWGAANRNSETGAVTAYLCGTSAMTASCSRAGGGWYTSSVMQKADQWEEWIRQGIFN
jgi:membrane-bound lytic murein transglycosylase B